MSTSLRIPLHGQFQNQEVRLLFLIYLHHLHTFNFNSSSSYSYRSLLPASLLTARTMCLVFLLAVGKVNSSFNADLISGNSYIAPNHDLSWRSLLLTLLLVVAVTDKVCFPCKHDITNSEFLMSQLEII